MKDNYGCAAMMLNEAIEHCKEKEDCSPCGAEHRQLRQWLENYQFLCNLGQDIDRTKELIECEYQCILRQSEGHQCNRNCAECDLVQNDVELLQMYSKVMSILTYLKQAYLSNKLPTAHWLECDKADFKYCCSRCGYGYTDNKTSYCYDCGAKMS